MSQLRCNGKVPTIVFGEVARDIVACKEVVAGFITWYWI